MSKGKHLAPKYHGYTGGLAEITICEDCGNTGLYEDQHTNNPCNNCGGAVHSGFSGTYERFRWNHLKAFKKSKVSFDFDIDPSMLIEKSHLADSSCASFVGGNISEDASYTAQALQRYFPFMF